MNALLDGRVAEHQLNDWATKRLGQANAELHRRLLGWIKAQHTAGRKSPCEPSTLPGGDSRALRPHSRPHQARASLGALLGGSEHGQGYPHPSWIGARLRTHAALTGLALVDDAASGAILAALDSHMRSLLGAASTFARARRRQTIGPEDLLSASFSSGHALGGETEFHLTSLSLIGSENRDL